MTAFFSNAINLRMGMGIFFKALLWAFLWNSWAYSFQDLTSKNFEFLDLEQNINSILDETTPFSGPNCHNTSLRALDLFKHKRYIHESEMQFFLDEYCALDKDKNFGVIFFNDSPVHSFIKIDNNLVFTKNGVSKRALPLIQSYDDMIKLHSEAYKKRCKIYDLTSCNIKINYFSCKKPSVFSDIEKITRHLHLISLKREDFFKKANQQHLLELSKEINWSKSCYEKKGIFESIKLSVNLANMSSLGLEERFRTEELEENLAEIEKEAKCLN